jgi:toxin ParE1/3/4
MRTRRYRLSRQASADLDAISDFLAARSQSAARRVMLELRDTFQFLADHPDAGTGRDDLRPGLRIFVPSRPASNYVVFYRSCEIVEIITVVHAARDWTEMFASGER